MKITKLDQAKKLKRLQTKQKALKNALCGLKNNKARLATLKDNHNKQRREIYALYSADIKKAKENISHFETLIENLI